MIFRTITLIAIFLISVQFNAHAVVFVQPDAQSEILKEKGLTKETLKEKLQQFSAKKRAKLKKKFKKIKKKLDRKRSADGTNERSAVGTGLVIVLIGLLVAILGFAGIADILVTIGIVVLVVGLFLWLLGAL